MSRTVILAVLALLAITGCQQTPPVKKIVIKQDFERLERIDRLLNEAEVAFQKQRLTTPVEDNAYLRYLQVLAEDPGNLEAEAGISRLVETYLAWAVDAIDKDQFSRATNMLNKANSLDEANLAIDTLRTRLKKAQNSEKLVFEISQQDLNQRSELITAKITEIANLLETRNATARIKAWTDSDARWIYQQLNEATASRVRATIQTGSSPSVQLSFP